MNFTYPESYLHTQRIIKKTALGQHTKSPRISILEKLLVADSHAILKHHKSSSGTISESCLGSFYFFFFLSMSLKSLLRIFYFCHLIWETTLLQVACEKCIYRKFNWKFKRGWNQEGYCQDTMAFLVGLGEMENKLNGCCGWIKLF